VNFCVVYIDDILAFSKTLEEHKKRLKIYCQFQKNGIRSILSPKKIEVEKESIEFFRLVLNQSGLKTRTYNL
jgi:hypothetical protein